MAVGISIVEEIDEMLKVEKKKLSYLFDSRISIIFGTIDVRLIDLKDFALVTSCFPIFGMKVTYSIYGVDGELFCSFLSL